MGRIKKAASSKHDATVSPALSSFASKATSVPLPELPSLLAEFPRRWPFPRGDLYHWIDVLDRFDGILERFIKHYKLHSPQKKSFDTSFLVAEHGADIQQFGFGPEGDADLIHSILEFSRLLLEKCGNRSLYSSSERLNCLLNTSSLSLLYTTLRLALCLAQRYNARQRPNHFQPSLLLSHYNIDLEKVQQLAMPPRRPRPLGKSLNSGSVKTPKGKDRSTRPSALQTDSPSANGANDFTQLATSSTDGDSSPSYTEADLDSWALVEVTMPKSNTDDPAANDADNFVMPDTPSRTSPLRRSSNLNGGAVDRSVEDSPRASRTAFGQSDSDTPSKIVIEPEEIRSSSIEDLVEKYSGELPYSTQYELLTKIRASKAVVTSRTTRQQLLAIRLLAVSNLSYIYPEHLFQSKVLQHEAEEPKRWQLVNQLTEILSLGCTRGGVPLHIQTLSLGTLRALSKHKSKLNEILAALSINVNHGVLLSATRKGLEDMQQDQDETDNEEGDEWREALFTLLHTLVLMSPPPTRSSDSFVPSSMILRYVDVLNLRTEKAQRVYLRILEFFETFVHSVKDGLAVLSANQAIEAVTNVLHFEVEDSLKQVKEGKGLAKEYRTQSTDYSVPYFNQQTIRFLLPFIDGAVGQSGTAADRILRNLIDSPPLLAAFKSILEHPQEFGAHVWSSVIKVMSNFLHNEPTSYTVLAEAGLSQSFLSSIGARPPPHPAAAQPESSTTEQTNEDETSSENADETMSDVESESPPKVIDASEVVGNAKVGILASPEAISIVSQAFSAICLTTTGFNSFKASGALGVFFDLFQSPAHVKSMTEASYLQSIGNTFDELARHHPGLRMEILSSVMVMVARLRLLCKVKALELGAGTKLWIEDASGKLSVAGGTEVLIDRESTSDSDAPTGNYELELPNGDKLIVEPADKFANPQIERVAEDEKDSHGLTVSDYISPVMWFLLGFFENQSLCSSFIDYGGVELIMDIATASSLPHESSTDNSTMGNSPLDMAQVIHMMADTKAHIVIPSLMNRTLTVVRQLDDFSQKQPRGPTCFFEPLISNEVDEQSLSDDQKWVQTNGTTIARNLSAALNLTRIFHEVYSSPMYHTRHSQQPSPFSHVNLVDRYVELVKKLGSLHAACVREAVVLQERTPKAWKEETRLKDFRTGVDEADEMLGLVRVPTEHVATEGDEAQTAEQDTKNEEEKAALEAKEKLEKDKNSAAFRNVKVLRSLLSQTPFAITQFFRLLALGLVPKRRMDSNAKQNMTEVADAMAEALISGFDPPFFNSEEDFPSKEEFRKYRAAYLIVMLADLSAVILEMNGATPQSLATTSILIAVKKAGGIERVRKLGEEFYEEVSSRVEEAKDLTTKSSSPSVVEISLSGLRMILDLFSLLTSAKIIVETPQANALKSTDRDRPFWFVPSQLLLELRMEALPLVRKIWSNAIFIDRASRNTIESLIATLRHVLEGDLEAEALRASDEMPPVPAPQRRRFQPSRDRVTHLMESDAGYDDALVREALFRCTSSREHLDDYCRAYMRNPRVPRNPIPPEVESSILDPRSTPRRDSSEMSISRSDSNQAFITGQQPFLRNIITLPTGMNISETPAPEADFILESANPANTDSTDDSASHMRMSLENILNQDAATRDGTPVVRPSEVSEPSAPTQARSSGFLTVEDIDVQREEIRSDLAERCLDVLNNHYEVTFELAELVNAASKKLNSNDRTEFQRMIGELLINTLVSTQSDLETHEGSQSAGKKVAAHAHLLALLLQDKIMYSECLDSLKDSYSGLLGFIKVPQFSDAKSQENSSPWVPQVLLIVERMLSDDSEPAEVSWNPESPETEPVSDVLTKEVITIEEKKELFTSIIDVLPRIGKDSALALSIARVMVILTRDRTIATMLGEKRNLQRLFLMVKQLGGDTNDRLRSAFMIVLRHIIEDDEIIRQIMTSEIVANFETRSHGRQIDTTAYVRQMFHIVLRAPRIFVEVTNEKLKLQHYDRRQRLQTLALKDEKKDESTSRKPSPPNAETTAEEDRAVETTEAAPAEDPEVKPKPSLKIPIVEHPDGVIHYLLSELMSYKDVDDKEPVQVSTEKDQHVEAVSDTESESTQTDTPFPRSQTSSPVPVASNKTEKNVFKAEEHPIYIYRCFLLQCLTELLHSYNRTKIEFISFSRRADPAAVTPSKARSGVLNYLLHNLIPLKSLNHDDSYQHKKRLTVSDWAMRVIIALCSKTGELGTSAGRERYWNYQRVNDNDDEEDLNFVREFVLQHAMKAFKEANASAEPLDSKYARMLGLAELFNKLLAKPSLAEGEAGSNNTSYKTIGKMMFQKNFISILTSSIADLDLSFSGAKRLAKAILKPLDQLTSTALQLSLHSDTTLTSPLGQTEEDHISSASSVSDMDEEREETPDLFRNSALGMMDPNREEMTDSEEEDEDDENEMYEEDYDDEMDYEEDVGPVADDGEVVSDEDVEDMEGPGPIEGIPGDVPLDLELVMDDDGSGSEDEDDEDEDDDEDDDDLDDDDDDDIEIDEDEAMMTGEINEDDDNESLAEDDGDIEWESDNDADDEHHDHDIEEDLDNDEADLEAVVNQVTNAGNGQGGPDTNQGRLSNLLQMIDGLEDEADFRELARNADEDMDEDDENDEEDGEDLDENDDDAPFHTLDEILDDESQAPWAWEADPSNAFMRNPHHHHHHHRHHHFRGGPAAFAVTGGPTRGLPIGALGRSRHLPSAPRGADDGTNPLLQRPGHSIGATIGSMPPIDIPGFGGGFMVSSVPGSGDMFEMIMQAVQRGDGRVEMSQSNGRFDIRIDGVPSEFRSFIRGVPPSAPHSSNINRDDPVRAVKFTAAMTIVRWQEEAKILYGSLHQDKTQRLINPILRVLVPPAIEEEEARRKRAEEERKREEEERERQRQEEKAREEAERKRKEDEEREAAAKAAAEAEAAATAAAQAQDGGNAAAGPSETAEPMQDVQPTETSETTEQGSSEPAAAAPAVPRVYTTIRGRQLDITDLAIDPQFLEELPEEIREEVIMQQYAEQRHQAQEQGQAPSEINPDFLDALPEEIREELLQQEAAERRRREREAARRRATETGGPARAEEMDPDSFMASLDPSLRRSILADQPEEIIAALAPEFAAEARQMFQSQLRHMNRMGLAREPRDDQDNPERQPQKETKKQVVQMVDKAGVATLLRLMFMPQHGSARTSLHNVLHNICEHRQTRGEVVSLLLLILQDGTADISAVEKSLAHLSLRARTSSAQKTPQPLKRTLSIQTNQPGNEVTPIMIVQQCLGALESLTSYNPHVAPVFLRELESPSAKSRANKKGKGKENRVNKFALNSLLSLLDRPLITDNASCMETLSSLLQEITKPLPWLLKKDKPEEVSKEDKPADEAPTEGQQPAATTEESRDTDTAMTEAAPLPSAETSDPAPTTETEGAAESSKSNEPKPTEPPKARKLFDAPVIPEQNLRLVVSVLAARECNSKIFRDILSTISYLSVLPGAKEVFGKELISQAQSLSQAILSDLDELLQTLNNAQAGAEIHGLAVEKFTPPSAHQTKFLRVLTALDYLFDPKRDENKDKTESEVTQGKEDLLTTLYESSSFGPVWSKLSDCLTIIRQKEGMMSVATILLSLIESLMVVCKNTSLKDAPISRSLRERSIQSPGPESGMENLFYNFTEEHRKILNELVRINPKLMSGSFSLLVKNPKVLEFDNKRNYFNRQIHSRAREVRHPQPPLQLSVRRDQVFLDSFKSLYFKSAEEMKHGKLSIRFHGEEGVDAGGVTREWFQVLARGMFNPDYALFIPVASDRTTFHPNRLSGVNNEHLMFFKFIGRIIGKALYEGRVLDCHFSRAVYKCILGKSVSIKDMETLDLDYYKSLVWMLENDITDIITETFSVETDDFGEAKTIDLIENGRNIPVTEENKQEYVQLVVEYRLTGSVKEQLEHFLKGFHDIIPAELISIFNEQELELLISGLPDIDVDDWKANTEYHNYSASSQQIQWFWRAVRSFDKEEQAKLLQFVTGTSKVPLNGFKELEGMNGFSRFNIHKDYGNKERLPSSHTCFNQLDLPEYDSYETLRQRLYMAVTTGSEYFGFA